MDKTRAVVIYALIATLMAAFPTLLYIPIPEPNKDVLQIVLGFFIAKGGDAVGYLINSTQTSKARMDAIIATAQQPPLAGGVTISPPSTVTVTTAEDPQDLGIPTLKPT